MFITQITPCQPARQVWAVCAVIRRAPPGGMWAKGLITLICEPFGLFVAIIYKPVLTVMSELIL